MTQEDTTESLCDSDAETDGKSEAAEEDDDEAGKKDEDEDISTKGQAERAVGRRPVNKKAKKM